MSLGTVEVFEMFVVIWALWTSAFLAQNLPGRGVHRMVVLSGKDWIVVYAPLTGVLCFPRLEVGCRPDTLRAIPLYSSLRPSGPNLEDLVRLWPKPENLRRCGLTTRRGEKLFWIVGKRGVGLNVQERLGEAMHALSVWHDSTFCDLPKKIKEAEKELVKIQSRSVSHHSATEGRKLQEQIEKWQRDLESYWFMRSREAEVRRGDKNTSYFHKKASGRRRRNTIRTLKKEDGGWTSSVEELVDTITKFYDNLFTSEGCEEMEEALLGVDQKVTDQMN